MWPFFSLFQFSMYFSTFKALKIAVRNIKKFYISILTFSLLLLFFFFFNFNSIYVLFYLVLTVLMIRVITYIHIYFRIEKCHLENLFLSLTAQELQV